MSDIEMVVKIPEEIYKASQIIGVKHENVIQIPLEVIANGIPLPKGHGAIKDVSQIEIPMCEDRTYERWVQVAIDSAPTIIEKDGDLTEI
jgi:hypothetical protein